MPSVEPLSALSASSGSAPALMRWARATATISAGLSPRLRPPASRFLSGWRGRPKRRVVCLICMLGPRALRVAAAMNARDASSCIGPRLRIDQRTRRRLAVRRNVVTDAVLGADRDAVRAELCAQLADHHLDDLHLALAVAAPDRFEQLRLRHHLALEQNAEQVRLARREPPDAGQHWAHAEQALEFLDAVAQPRGLAVAH